MGGALQYSEYVGVPVSNEHLGTVQWYLAEPPSVNWTCHELRAIIETIAAAPPSFKLDVSFAI